MRVLGDVDASPEIDTSVLDTLPGDRWLLCSDGLSSYVSDDKIKAALKTLGDPDAAANRLVKDALDQGAPDNVTVVIVDIGEDTTSATIPPKIVGSAAEPLSFEASVARRPLRLPTLLLHPLKSTLHEDSHFEPESDEYLQELIAEDRRRHRRRRITWLVAIALIIALLFALLAAGYRWTQTHYFVGPNGYTIAIFKGVQQDIGPIKLSSVYEVTSIQLNELSPF
jgi:protein phosphatase